MTNIQAINLLKGLEQSLDDYCELNDEGKTAFHMAITALEVFGNSEQLPSAQSEVKPISYTDCANAMLKMWMDKVVTDGEYNRIMDKLNKHESERKTDAE